MRWHCTFTRRATRLLLLSIGLTFFGVDAASAQRMTDAEFEAAVAKLSAASAEERVAAVDVLSSRAWRKRDALTPHFRRLSRDDSDWRVRASVARAIGRLSIREAVPDLVRGLRDPRVEVRVVAAAALWRLPDPAAVPALLELLDDSDPAARQWATLALGVVQDRRATAPLVSILNDREATVRLDAIRSLGRIADERALAPLAAFAADGNRNADERLEAVNAIARLSGADKVNALLRLLEGHDETIRIQVIGAIGEAGDALVLPALRRERAADRDRDTRRAIDDAIEAVERRMREASSGEPHAALVLP
jgi:HEAT repeat protein